MYNVHSARPGKCQKSYTNKIVRNQFGAKFTLSTVVKTHINSNIQIVITGPLLFRGTLADYFEHTPGAERLIHGGKLFQKEIVL